MADETIDAPPFPPLTWDDYAWEAETTLPAWAGFRSSRGPYGARDSHAPSDGTVRLSVEVPGDDPEPPSPEQIAAYARLVAGQDATRDAILGAFFDRYPGIRDEYGQDYDEDEIDTFLPRIEGPNDLRRLIGLSTVHLLTVARDGIAYIGYELGCTWEEEHGLGVMTHDGRIVEVGGADISFLDWIAERDIDGN